MIELTESAHLNWMRAARPLFRHHAGIEDTLVDASAKHARKHDTLGLRRFGLDGLDSE